jgi:RNA polymerase sigma-70 factor (ECF subfamily)
MKLPYNEQHMYTRRTSKGSNISETREVQVDGEETIIPSGSMELDRDRHKRLFEQFVAAESGALLRLANRVLGDPEEARDVVQDALWKAYRSLERFRWDSSLKSWVWRITLNEGLKRIRRRQRWERVTNWLGGGRLHSLGREENPNQQPDQQIEIKKQALKLQKSLARLPARQQVVVTLRYFEDLSIEEIGVSLGIAPGTVKTHLIRAVRQMRTDWRA